MPLPAAKQVKDYSDIVETYDPSQNQTSCRLTKYEKTQLIGIRMEQIARSGKAYVPIDPNEPFNPYKLALRELEENKLPFMLRRTLPNGIKEVWRLEDMIKTS